MKFFHKLILILAGVFVFSTITAQDTLLVEPGLGTLNAAIDANGGNRIYKLRAGDWYGLSAIVENIDYHLQIIGEEYDDVTRPATIQTGVTEEGNPFANMFSAKGSLTLKNVYVLNATINGQTADRCIVQSQAGAKVKIDKCVLDPMGYYSAIELTGGDNDLFFTNNIAARHGHLSGLNDGHCFIINDPVAAHGADTVFFENNTFISTGMNVLNGNFNAHVTNFLMFNHNTFIHHKSQVDWSIFENEYYMTNNLFFDFMTAPFSYDWQPMPGGDVSMPKPMLIFADKIEGETLPSTRSQFIQYNNLFRHQGFYKLVSEMNDTALATGEAMVNLLPFIWDGATPEYFGADPDEAFAASREGHLFNHENNTNADFPSWKYGNTSYDVDPLFADSMIYALSDKFIQWSYPANFIHALGQSANSWPPPSEWPDWHWDPDGNIGANDTWPLIDASYINSELLSASIEGLPLGDLNWFPEAKEAWEANKNEIFAHIHALDEGTIDIGYFNICDTADILINYLAHSPTCPGDSDGSIDISVSGNYAEFEYLWSTGSIKEDLTELEHGTYKLVVIDSAGCASTESIVLENPDRVNIAYISGDNTVEEFLTYQYSITDEEQSIFHWFTEGGSITSGQGTYMVDIQWGTDGNGLVKAIRETELGCLSDTTYLEVSINSTGVEMHIECDHYIFPNPVEDILHINYPEELSVTVSNLDGKAILFTNEKQIDLSSLPKGLYIINIKSKDYVTTKKIIKL